VKQNTIVETEEIDLRFKVGNADCLKHIQGFASLLGSHLLRALFIIITAGSKYFAVDDRLDGENFRTVSRSIFNLHETHFLTCLLTPFDKAAFEIGFCLLQQLDIDMRFDDTVDQEI